MCEPENSHSNVGLVVAGVTTLAYDGIGRFTRDLRDGATPYDLTYEYDLGGNCRKKGGQSPGRKKGDKRGTVTNMSPP